MSKPLPEIVRTVGGRVWHYIHINRPKTYCGKVVSDRDEYRQGTATCKRCLDSPWYEIDRLIQQMEAR